MSKKITARIATIQILRSLKKQQGSLAGEIPHFTQGLEDQEKRFTQELCYGVCRWYFLLEHQLNSLLDKPLKAKDIDIHLLLLLGIYQLQFTRVAAHAAINETVNSAVFFRKQWAKKLINGVLRNFQRQQDSEALNADTLHTLIPSADKISHPQWLQEAIVKAWPVQAKSIFTANNQHPPFTLRVNQQHTSAAEYAIALAEYHQESVQLDIPVTPTPHSPVGLTLDRATDVTQLPGFNEGNISVQDEAAQLAAGLLQLQPQQRVLDACCAPGGKTCHIGEVEPTLNRLVAIDLEERRLVRVRENIQRLSIAADIICGDASQPEHWWDGQVFDRILLDAPCSATGVIRRHPDIKLLRTPQAIVELVKLQASLLRALWPLLADQGILVYATCSVLPEENTQQIQQFLAAHPDARHDIINAQWGLTQEYGRQLFPQPNGHDGFYYARLRKTASALSQ